MKEPLIKFAMRSFTAIVSSRTFNELALGLKLCSAQNDSKIRFLKGPIVLGLRMTLAALFTMGMLSSCYRGPKHIEPTVHCPITERQLSRLGSAFEPLSTDELQKDWGREYFVGVHFSKELDFYRAITSFKRAALLASVDKSPRQTQIEYSICLAYFLAGKYRDVAKTFEMGSLSHSVNEKFPAFHDLLVILHESYLKLGEKERAHDALRYLEKSAPKAAYKVALFDALGSADFKVLDIKAAKGPFSKDISSFQKTYHERAKSLRKASLLSLFPGAGYLYVGQTRSAITSFLINSLFIAGAWTCFTHRNFAAGMILTGFETGWYFGGIYGATQAAKRYNEELYGAQARFISEHHHLAPTLQLSFGF